jgi:hypothetical protein
VDFDGGGHPTVCHLSYIAILPAVCCARQVQGNTPPRTIHNSDRPVSLTSDQISYSFAFGSSEPERLANNPHLSPWPRPALKILFAPIRRNFASQSVPCRPHRICMQLPLGYHHSSSRKSSSSSTPSSSMKPSSSAVTFSPGARPARDLGWLTLGIAGREVAGCGFCSCATASQASIQSK